MNKYFLWVFFLVQYVFKCVWLYKCGHFYHTFPSVILLLLLCTNAEGNMCQNTKGSFLCAERPLKCVLKCQKKIVLMVPSLSILAQDFSIFCRAGTTSTILCNPIVVLCSFCNCSLESSWMDMTSLCLTLLLLLLCTTTSILEMSTSQSRAVSSNIPTKDGKKTRIWEIDWSKAECSGSITWKPQ